VGYMTSPYLVPCAGTLETATGLGQGGIACPLEGICSVLQSARVVYVWVE
jgi:hypothetical protein